MAKKLPLKSFHVKNFKAIRDSGIVRFTPLTVLIGDNGSGKSSLVEGLQTYQSIVKNGLVTALKQFGGFTKICNSINQSVANSGIDGDRTALNCIEFRVCYHTEQNHCAEMRLMYDALRFQPRIEHESIWSEGEIQVRRNEEGWMFDSDGRRFDQGPKTFPPPRRPDRLSEDQSLLDGFKDLSTFYSEMAVLVWTWQFLALNPWSTGTPYEFESVHEWTSLNSDGSNIAEYLLDIRRQDVDAFDGIVETLQFVLPYARGLEPILSSALEREVYLQMTEGDKKIPGWMLSQGTLRILALLALFRHPKPPPLIVIEEIENGLDPRAIHLIVEEMRNVVESGRSQVVVTTHSPYLLDLLPLWSIVLVERSVDKGTVFFRPDEQPELDSWLERFGPGKLYTMQGLRLGANQ